MTVQEQIEHLEHERDYWKLMFIHRGKPYIPKWIPAYIRTGDKVHGDGPWASTRAEPGVRPVECNRFGAMSVKATNGRMLGVKPGEVEEFVSWKINPAYEDF